jgi:hypothetical protein
LVNEWGRNWPHSFWARSRKANFRGTSLKIFGRFEAKKVTIIVENEPENEWLPS